MEVPISPVTTTLTWETCPEELLRMILKQLSLKCLLSCMTVNRRWNAIVLDYIELNSLWPKIFSTIMVNKGRTFRRKSVFGIKNMLMNSLLWSFVPLAQIDLHHTYELPNMRRILVNKEKLILIADPRTNTRPIRYYNVTNKELTKSLSSTEIDFRENDYMIVMLVKGGRELLAFGKENPDDHGANDELLYTMLNPLLYRLEDNICYVVAKHNVIWALIWDKKEWDLKSRGRYYGNELDILCGIYVYDERVYLVTKLGIVLREDPSTRSYQKVNSYVLLPSVNDFSVLEMFNQNGLAISVKNSQRIKVCHHSTRYLKWLECGDMTCATEHGEVLFIGYKDGTVAICTPNSMSDTHDQPDRLFNVQDFDASIELPSILAVEVFENKLCHHLFVATQHKVLQLLITYPDHVREYYEQALLSLPNNVTITDT
ncbi:hypothetical protein PYW08_014934 [Mythimna loreyi]|uniref:Uncharacterized protein n=1 Tax=Mythimna loreyi TaxID=667449 RepID=A0ACC2R3Y7_9NEOP|nr:hypothetical protein PYW08_014934 [Mythimna loreyi]